MVTTQTTGNLIRSRLVQGAALAYLLVLVGLALFGPSGLLALGENKARLSQHRAAIAELQQDRAELKNRVELLNPGKVDPDLAGELVRDGLNVMHPDEVVIELGQQGR